MATSAMSLAHRLDSPMKLQSSMQRILSRYAHERFAWRLGDLVEVQRTAKRWQLVLERITGRPLVFTDHTS